jgi:pimeloyl-ACP methyl ester carboxylesterase
MGTARAVELGNPAAAPNGRARQDGGMDVLPALVTLPLSTGRVAVALVAAPVALLVALYVAVCAYAAHRLTLPQRRPLERSPADYGLAYETVAFPSREDALRLGGWLVAPQRPVLPGAEPRPVVLVHGRGGDRLHELDGRFLEIAAALAGDGRRVLVFDLRGYGTSQGRRYTLGGREVRDVGGAIDFLTAAGLAPDGVDLAGFSMGAASALLAAAAEPRVRAVVADSAFADLREVLAVQVPRLSRLPRFFTPGVLLAARLLTGVDPATLRPEVAVPALAARATPLLVVHGDRDDWVPQGHGRRLAAAYGAAAETAFIAGAGHVGAYALDPSTYLARLLAFLDRAESSDLAAAA